jgi:glyoxylase-like metal-dependent hydrolase (beta-lactamase superfamily II)
MLVAVSTHAFEAGRLSIEALDAAGSDAWLIIQKRPVWSNSILVETADGTLVLCDTPMTEPATNDLLEWTRQRYGERRWIVINTHFHPDCTAGNAAMIDAGAEVWASSTTAMLLDEHGQGFMEELVQQNEDDPDLVADLRTTRLAAPTHVFDPSEPQVLPIEGERVSIHFPGAAHSPDNIVVFFEKRQLLFAGCLCFSASRDQPGYVGDADLASWPATLESVQALDAEVVVPGHGGPGGPELLEHTARCIQRYLREQEK